MYKLLIVDDNAIQVKSLLHYIDWQSFDFTEIETAINGIDGIKKYLSFHPDLIIADIAMPVMNGLEMMQKIRESGGDTVVIFISCYDSFEYLQSANKIEAASYVLKPLKQEQLEESVKKAIADLQKKEKEIKGSCVENEVLRLRRENFMYHLLNLNDDGVKVIASEKQACRFDSVTAFVLVKFDIINNEFSKVYDYITYLKSIAGNRNVIVSSQSEKRILLLFMSNTDNDDKFVENVRECVNNSIRDALEIYNLAIIATGSKVVESIFDIPVLIKELSYSPDSIEAGDNFATFTPYGDQYNVLAIKNKIEDIIFSDDEEKMRLFAAEFRKDAESKHINIEVIFTSLWAAIQMILAEYNIDVENTIGVSVTSFNKRHIFDNYEPFERWVYNMVRMLCEYVKKNDNGEPVSVVSKLISYINENFSTISNINDITTQCYISPSYARRLFKNVMGMTVFEYLLSVRMDKAKTLLSRGNMKMHEIALEVGYESKANFIRAFKKSTGMLPSDFRNMVSNDNTAE